MYEMIIIYYNWLSELHAIQATPIKGDYNAHLSWASDHYTLSCLGQIGLTSPSL